MGSRKHARYRVEYLGSFSGERISAQGVILDLSLAGSRARSSFALKKDVCIGVLIHVPRYEHPLHVGRAVVRWSKGQEFGMEFIHMDPEDQQRLHQLIRQTEVDGALRTQRSDSVRPN